MDFELSVLVLITGGYGVWCLVVAVAGHGVWWLQSVAMEFGGCSRPHHRFPV
jgi:hypothetical protein